MTLSLNLHPFCKPIYSITYRLCREGAKHTHKCTGVKQTTQSWVIKHRGNQTTAFPLAVYSLKCLVSSFFLFPVPPSKAPQREKGNKERRESSLLNPCRAERWGEAGGETHEEGWGEVESGTDREGGEKILGHEKKFDREKWENGKEEEIKTAWEGEIKSEKLGGPIVAEL